MWLLTFSQLYHQEIEELAALAYKEILKEFTAAQIDRGCREAVRRCTFIPKPADIISCIWDTRPTTPELKSLPEPSMTEEQAREFFAIAREKLGDILKAPAQNLEREGVVVITEEKRAEYERKKKEALARFGKSA